MSMKSKYWQMIRGICILAVIAIHCPRVYEGNDVFLYLVVRNVINFPVALFAFMAGYFIKIKKVNLCWLKNRGGAIACSFCNMESNIFCEEFYLSIA